MLAGNMNWTSLKHMPCPGMFQERKQNNFFQVNSATCNSLNRIQLRQDLAVLCKIHWVIYLLDRLPMAERVGCGTPCLLGSLGVREVMGSRPDRGNSEESVSSNQETSKVFSPEMPFYS